MEKRQNYDLVVNDKANEIMNDLDIAPDKREGFIRKMGQIGSHWASIADKTEAQRLALDDSWQSLDHSHNADHAF